MTNPPKKKSEEKQEEQKRFDDALVHLLKAPPQPHKTEKKTPKKR